MNANKQAGFTLIELIIVVIIIGIISIGAVSINWNTGPKLKAFANQLAMRIRYVQNYANTQDTAYRLTFSSSQMTFTSSDGTTPINFPSTGTNILTLSSGYSWTISGLPNDYIIYSHDGEPYTDAAISNRLNSNATITINYDGNSKVVTISGVSGTVLKVT